jgi:hypothetical protein
MASLSSIRHSSTFNSRMANRSTCNKPHMASKGTSLSSSNRVILAALLRQVLWLEPLAGLYCTRPLIIKVVGGNDLKKGYMLSGAMDDVQAAIARL